MSELARAKSKLAQLHEDCERLRIVAFAARLVADQNFYVLPAGMTALRRALDALDDQEEK